MQEQQLKKALEGIALLPADYLDPIITIPRERTCDYCTQTVVNQVFTYYIRGIGTHRATQVRHCSSCGERTPCGLKRLNKDAGH